MSQDILCPVKVSEKPPHQPQALWGSRLASTVGYSCSFSEEGPTTGMHGFPGQPHFGRLHRGAYKVTTQLVLTRLSTNCWSCHSTYSRKSLNTFQSQTCANPVGKCDLSVLPSCQVSFTMWPRMIWPWLTLVPRR